MGWLRKLTRALGGKQESRPPLKWVKPVKITLEPILRWNGKEQDAYRQAFLKGIKDRAKGKNGRGK